ncbi:MAG: secondary thiamine-phosphate synthase enzyme YjbQ [Saprospiraceae bacterium]|nr:secondary thiamine-phosphate synthase enzyme YjbQ [Saprospiraceae bacterium]
MIQQKEILLPPMPRGFHLITRLILQESPSLPESGLFHLFIKHTSAALTINENADPTVREDFEQIFNRIVPENLPFLKHNLEGLDDMPAHIKAAMIGSSITIPITKAQFNLGIWQGIYLCEFRNRGGARSLVATIYS